MDNRPAGKGNGLEECSLVKELEEGSGFDNVSEWCHRHSHHGEGKTRNHTHKSTLHPTWAPTRTCTNGRER